MKGNFPVSLRVGRNSNILSTVVELTFAGTYSAMASLYRLASGNHQFAKYAGKSINFAHMAGHWGTQAVMIARPKAEAKADPKSI